MKNAVINFAEKLAKFHDHWQPRVVAELNDYEFKLVKVQGEFVWHKHDDTDEAFIVLSGELHIDLVDQPGVVLRAGEMYVVPRGVMHKPSAKHEVEMMLIEPKGVINTGDSEDLTLRAELGAKI